MKYLDLIIGGSVLVFTVLVSYAMTGSKKASPYTTKKRLDHYNKIMGQVNTDRGKNDYNSEGGSRKIKIGKNRKTKKY